MLPVCLGMVAAESHTDEYFVILRSQCKNSWVAANKFGFFITYNIIIVNKQTINVTIYRTDSVRITAARK